MLQGLWGLEFRVPWFNVEVEGFGVGLGGSWVCAFVVFLRGLDGWWGLFLLWMCVHSICC